MAPPERPRTSLVLKHYAVSSVLYGLLLAFLALNPWFRTLVRTEWAGYTALQLYGAFYLLYVLGALPVFLLSRPPSLCRSKSLVLYGLVCRTVRGVVRKGQGRGGDGSCPENRVSPGQAGDETSPPLALSGAEKQALMFLLIRLFFGPLSLSWLLVELGWCQRLGTRLHPGSFMGRLDLYYIVLVHVIFLADAALYLVGYHTEAACLKNEVRYVDTRLWRVLVCLVCYPPFNQVTSSLLGASCQDPYLVVQGNFQGLWTWCLRLLAVLSLGLLLSASLALFTRASNLTHRGIVSWGPYRFVRHPGYLAQNLFWLLTFIPWLVPNPRNVYFTWPTYWLGCLGIVCGFTAWASIFFLRAVAEEQFLSVDPDYVAYCKRVPYRFIPRVY